MTRHWPDPYREATAAPSADGSVLILTAQTRMGERLQMVVAAAGLRPQVAAPSPDAGWLDGWSTARAVLIDAEALQDVVLLDPLRRSEVYVVAERALPEHCWRMCVLVGAEDAIVLDEAEGLLVDRLSMIDPMPPDGLMVGVLGACGGVGASTLAAALSIAAYRSGRDCMLIDADPRAGALDQLLGFDRPGLGWGDLGSLRGRIDGSALRGAVSAMSDLPVLTHGRDEPMVGVPAEAVRTAAVAAAAVLGTAVVDLGGGREDLLDLPDALVVVSTSDIRGALALRRFAERHPVGQQPVVVAARTPHRRCLPAAQFTELADGLGPVYWCSEIRRYAARLARAGRVVRRRDRLVGDACAVLDAVEVSLEIDR